MSRWLLAAAMSLMSCYPDLPTSETEPWVRGPGVGITTSGDWAFDNFTKDATFSSEHHEFDNYTVVRFASAQPSVEVDISFVFKGTGTGTFTNSTASCGLTVINPQTGARWHATTASSVEDAKGSCRATFTSSANGVAHGTLSGLLNADFSTAATKPLKLAMSF